MARSRRRGDAVSAEPVTALALWMSKIAGAVAGSAISVAYLLPRGRREAASRFMIGTVTGVVFGPPAGLMLAAQLNIDQTLDSSELVLMGSAAASLCAWWALGVLGRFADGLFRVGDTVKVDWAKIDWSKGGGAKTGGVNAGEASDGVATSGKVEPTPRKGREDGR